MNAPRPDPPALLIEDKVKRFYDAASPLYFKVFGEHIHDGYYITGKESRKDAQEKLIRLLADKAGINKGCRVLDVGCGIGGSSIWLARQREAITVGITISPVQLDIARKLASEQKVDSSFLLMDAQNMEFSNPFDVIWILAALTHLPDQKDFLTRASQFLKPQGKLVIYDWVLNEDMPDIVNGQDIQSVIDGMVLSNLFSGNAYLRWLMDSHFRFTYVEDITAATMKTWDIEMALLKNPSIWRLTSGPPAAITSEVLTFLKGRKAIKQAMLKGKVKSLAVVAEKIG